MDDLTADPFLKSASTIRLIGRTKWRGKGLIRRLGKVSALFGVAVMTVLCSMEAAVAERFMLLPAATETIRSYGPADPTAAWTRFCRQFPDECAINPDEAALVSLTADIWTTITEVNERVNATILAVTDQDHWGVVDRWDFPDDGMGDCEDIQLLKRRLLAKAGLPRRAMRMTVVIDELGAGHAVMMVRTDHGDFILDNKRNAVLPWKQTGYTFLKREGTESKAWVALGDWAAPIVTVNR